MVLNMVLSEQFWERYELLHLSYGVVLNCKTVLPNDLRVLRMSFLFQEMSQNNREKL